jgi:hypothetical protein
LDNISMKTKIKTSVSMNSFSISCMFFSYYKVVEMRV